MPFWVRNQTLNLIEFYCLCRIIIFLFGSSWRAWITQGFPDYQEEHWPLNESLLSNRIKHLPLWQEIVSQPQLFMLRDTKGSWIGHSCRTGNYSLFYWLWDKNSNFVRKHFFAYNLCILYCVCFVPLFLPSNAPEIFLTDAFCAQINGSVQKFTTNQIRNPYQPTK